MKRSRQERSDEDQRDSLKYYDALPPVRVISFLILGQNVFQYGMQAHPCFPDLLFFNESIANCSVTEHSSFHSVEDLEVCRVADSSVLTETKEN